MPIVCRFFILQNAKFRKWELYKFFIRFCEVNKLENLDLVTVSCSRWESTERLYPSWKERRVRAICSKYWTDSFTDNAVGSLFLKSAVTSTEQMTRENRVFSRRVSVVRKCCVFVVKLTTATILPLTIWFSAKKVSISKQTIPEQRQFSEKVSQNYWWCSGNYNFKKRFFSFISTVQRIQKLNEDNCISILKGSWGLIKLALNLSICYFIN